ncbi:MAG: hypothetical protein FGM39_10820 [Phycisphaerales bacterium]|nr:hypothetical protein [Phycisphaerales bacterium]
MPCGGWQARCGAPCATSCARKACPSRGWMRHLRRCCGSSSVDDARSCPAGRRQSDHFDESDEVGANVKRVSGLLTAVDEPGMPSSRGRRPRLTAGHAAEILRIGAEGQSRPGAIDGSSREPGGMGVAPTEVPARHDLAHISAVVGRAGASVTLLLVASGLLVAGGPESGQPPPNGLVPRGSVPRSPRPAARAEPGDPGASLKTSETRSMQKQIMGVAALGAALAIGDASHAQAVQWRVEDGGNGHWYQREGLAVDWPEAQSRATQRGGHLVSIRSSDEYTFLNQAIGIQSDLFWTGGFQQPDACEPGCGWQWVTGEPWDYTNWNWSEPSDSLGNEHWMECYPGGLWNDRGEGPLVSVVEWSDDCNGDGIVDYGQILQEQLPDTNGNGVPDPCEVLTCANTDLFRDSNINGADLGILLSQWGPAQPQTVSDINRDGAVDGIDLGLLLSFWGPCPN